MIKLCLHIALIRFLTYLAGQVLGDPAAWNREDPGSPWQPASLPCFGRCPWFASSPPLTGRSLRSSLIGLLRAPPHALLVEAPWLAMTVAWAVLVALRP